MTDYQPAPPPSRTSDGQRVQKRPAKPCVGCKQIMPNTDEWFARGPTGRLTSTCLKCVETKTTNPRSRGQLGECPVCGQEQHLVDDRKGPKDNGKPLRVCRRCVLIARMTEPVDLSALDRLFDWMKWRRQ
jgi:hypothetical protein